MHNEKDSLETPTHPPTHTHVKEREHTMFLFIKVQGTDYENKILSYEGLSLSS